MTTIILNTVEAGPLVRRSYLNGFVSVFNLRGDTSGCYHLHSSGDEADAAAVQNDWETVSSDLQHAFETVISK